jgi:uncharacterized protein (DUF433 family)
MINDRIIFDPNIMGGKPCIRGSRVTVGMIINQLASGHTPDQIIAAYPYLVYEDIKAALQFAAYRVEETEEPLAV